MALPLLLGSVRNPGRVALSMSSRAPRWELTQAAFDSFLRVLDPDRGRAGEIYEEIRQRLLKFFEWRSLGDAASRADETLNRLARALQSGDKPRTAAGFPAAALPAGIPGSGG